MRRTSLRAHSYGLLLLTVLPFLLGGCGGKMPVVPLTGRVTYQGQAAPFVNVEFHPTDSGLREKKIIPVGTTKKDGSFTLTTYDMEDGAPEGEYKVALYWPGLAPGQVYNPEDPESRPEGADRFQGRYANPETTPITVTVAKGHAEIPVIDLK